MADPFASTRRIVQGSSVLEKDPFASTRAIVEGTASPSFLPSRDPSPRQTFGSSLVMTPRMVSAERGANTEYLNVKREAFLSGKGEEFEEFVERKGRAGFFGTWDYLAENLVQPSFDVLSSGNYAMAGFAQELMRTGNVWPAFQQAGLEFLNAMPGIEISGAKRPSFVEIFGEQGYGRWYHAVAGLAMDFVLDPMNLVPGVAIAKGLRKGADAAIVGSGPLGKAFDNLFRPKAVLERTAEGRQALKYENLRKAREADEGIRIRDRVEDMMEHLTGHEKVLLGAFLDSGRVKLELQRAKKMGLISEAQMQRALATAVPFRKMMDEFFTREEGFGLIAPGAKRPSYVTHYEAMNSKASKVQKEIILSRNDFARAHHKELRDPLAIESLGAEIAPGQLMAGLERTTPTIYDRLKHIYGLRKDASLHTPRTVELNIHNIARKRSVEHVKTVNWQIMLRDIASDPLISKGVDPDLLKTKNWEKQKSLLRSQHQGYDVMELRKKNADGVDEVYDAVMVPDAVAAYVQRMESGLSRADQIEPVLRTLHDITNVWKGWATFFTGYIARNVISSGVQNWQAGVGRAYGKGAKALLDGTIEAPGKGFLTRYNQALRTMAAATGSGRLPMGLGKASNALAAKIPNLPSLDLVKLPKVVDENGNQVKSWEELAALGERMGVPQSATRLYDVPEGFERDVWENLTATASMGKAKPGGLLDLTLQTSAAGAPTKGEAWFSKVKSLVGVDNPALKVNRAVAQMTENQARYAMWIDRLEKGFDPYEAALETKLWHFDYTELTAIEKRWFRLAMPFYAWTRFNVPRQIMAMIENPGRYSRIPKLRDALNEWNADWETVETPDYFEEMQTFATGMLDKDRPLFAQFDIPTLDLNRLGPSSVASSLHPFVSLAMTQIPKGGYSFFLEAPIERYPGEVGEGISISKKTEAALSTIMPPLGKFLFRPARAIARDELPEQIFSELSGVRVRAVDVRRVVRANAFARRDLARKFRAKMKAELERERG